MFVELPPDLAKVVSERAVRYAREFTQNKQWSGESTQSLTGVSDLGKVGIATTRRHLIFQSRGTKPYVMWGLEGKTVPMGDGTFRRATGVGQPGYVTLPGGVRTWRDQKWRHPGLKPQRFMEDSLNRAINELRRPMTDIMVRRMEGGGRTTFGGHVEDQWGGPR